MFSPINNLNPAKEYSFQTSPSGRTLPITVKQFLGTKYAAEQLITVDGGFGPGSTRIWSTYDGWDVNSFADLVREFVLFIDKSQVVNDEFINSAIKDGHGVFEAVATWFLGTELSIEITHHANGETGLLDIDIQGINTIRRVVIASNIKKGDMFNLYFGESSKGGGTWNTDLVTTLKNYFQLHAA